MLESTLIKIYTNLNETTAVLFTLRTLHEWDTFPALFYVLFQYTMHFKSNQYIHIWLPTCTYFAFHCFDCVYFLITYQLLNINYKIIVLLSIYSVINSVLLVVFWSLDGHESNSSFEVLFLQNTDISKPVSQIARPILDRFIILSHSHVRGCISRGDSKCWDKTQLAWLT